MYIVDAIAFDSNIVRTVSLEGRNRMVNMRAIDCITEGETNDNDVARTHLYVVWVHLNSGKELAFAFLEVAEKNAFQTRLAQGVNRVRGV